MTRIDVHRDRIWQQTRVYPLQQEKKLRRYWWNIAGVALQEEAITPDQEVKLLGIILSKRLEFKVHTSDVVNRSKPEHRIVYDRDKVCLQYSQSWRRILSGATWASTWTPKFLLHENKEDKHPLGTLLETARPKEISETGWDLTKALVFIFVYVRVINNWWGKEPKNPIYFGKVCIITSRTSMSKTASFVLLLEFCGCYGKKLKITKEERWDWMSKTIRQLYFFYFNLLCEPHLLTRSL